MKYFHNLSNETGIFNYFATNFRYNLPQQVKLTSSSTLNDGLYRDIYIIIYSGFDSDNVFSFLTEEKDTNQWLLIEFQKGYTSC